MPAWAAAADGDEFVGPTGLRAQLVISHYIDGRCSYTLYKDGAVNVKAESLMHVQRSERC